MRIITPETQPYRVRVWTSGAPSSFVAVLRARNEHEALYSVVLDEYPDVVRYKLVEVKES